MFLGETPINSKYLLTLRYVMCLESRCIFLAHNTHFQCRSPVNIFVLEKESLGGSRQGEGALLVPPQGGPSSVSTGAGVRAEGAEEGQHPGQRLHDRDR